MSSYIATFNILLTVCLNPCCNGIYSMRSQRGSAKKNLLLVLILVVMEYTQ